MTRDALGRKLPPLKPIDGMSIAATGMASFIDHLTRPSDNVLWLENAGRVMAANRERWAAEDAENDLTQASRNASRADGATHPIGEE